MAPLFQRCRGNVEAQSRFVGQVEISVRDARRLREEFGLQRVPLWIRKGFDNAAGGAGCDDVGMNEAVVMRRYLHVIQLRQRRHCFLPLLRCNKFRLK